MLADREDLFQPFTCDATPVLMCSTSTRVLEDPPHVFQAHLILLYFYFLLQGLTLYFQSLGRCSNGEELPGIDIEHSSFIQLSLGRWHWAVWACFLSSLLCLPFSSSRGSEPSPTGWGDGAMIDHQSERREVLSEWPTITHRAYLVVALRL